MGQGFGEIKWEFNTGVIAGGGCNPVVPKRGQGVFAIQLWWEVPRCFSQVVPKRVSGGLEVRADGVSQTGERGGWVGAKGGMCLSPSECRSRLLGGGAIGVSEKVRTEGSRGVDICRSPIGNGKGRLGEACTEGEYLASVGAHIPLSSCSVQVGSCGGPMEREATLSPGSGPSKPFPPIDFG